MAARAADPWYNAADTNLGTSYRIEDNVIYELLWNRGRAQGVPDGALITRQNVALEIQIRNQAQLFQFPMAPVQAAVAAVAQPQQATHSPRLPARLIGLMQLFERESNRLATELNLSARRPEDRDVTFVLNNPENYTLTLRLHGAQIEAIKKLRAIIIQLFIQYVHSTQHYFRDRIARGLFHIDANPRKLIVMLVGHGGMSHQNIRMPANIIFRSYNPPSLVSLLLPNALFWNRGHLHLPISYNNGNVTQFYAQYRMGLSTYNLVPNLTFHASNPVPETLHFGNGWNTVRGLDAAGIYIFYEGDNSDFEFIPHAKAVHLCGGNTLQQIIVFIQGYILNNYGKNTFEIISLLCQSIFQASDESLSSIFQIFSDPYDFGPDVFVQDKKSKIIEIFTTYVFSNIEMKTENARELGARLSQLMSRHELRAFLLYLQQEFNSLHGLNQYLLRKYTMGTDSFALVLLQDHKINTMIQIIDNLLSDPTLMQGVKQKRNKSIKHKRTKSKVRKQKRNSRK